MKLEGSYPFNAPRDIVWPLLQDPEVLASVMPGCEKLEQVGENEFEGILKIKVGPVQGKFNGKIKISDVNEPQSYNISVDGKGAPGFVKGKGGLNLVEENGQTILQYEGDAQVGGRLASVGQRLLDTSAKAIVRQGLEGLDSQVQARMTPATETGDVETAEFIPPPPPTQIEFATGVAKNMMDDMLAEEKRDELINKLIILGGAFLVITVLTNWFANKVANKVVRKLDK